MYITEITLTDVVTGRRDDDTNKSKRSAVSFSAKQAIIRIWFSDSSFSENVLFGTTYM